MNYIDENSRNKISSNSNRAISLIILLTLVIGFIYIVILNMTLSYNKINSADIMMFIRIFELILAVLASISCMLCYNSTNKEELFIISLMYIVFFVDVLLGNVDSLIFDDEIININSYITILTSLIRVSILLISISSFDKMKKLIINNKFKSIALVIILTFILGIFKNNNIMNTNFNDIREFINYNIFLAIVYTIVSVSYLIKSMKKGEYIYAVISASIFFFIIKAIYAIVGATNPLANIKLVSISITYMGFIVLIGGIICELILSIKRNKELEIELTVFKKIADESKYSCIIIYDEFKEVKYINEIALRYFKSNSSYSSKELSKRIYVKEDDMDEDTLKEIKSHVLQIGYWKGTIKIPKEDITISCSIQKIYIDNMKNTVVIFNDKSDRIRAKRYLIEYEKMKNQEQVRTEFFANISHELRTPLNIFYSTIQLLDMKSKKNKDNFAEIYDNHKQCLKTNCQRMLRLINNIVDITKIDVGFIKPKFVNCNIVRLVEDITLSVVNYAAPKQINIEFDTEIEEQIIRCDEDLMERAMLNLLSNAIKFTKQKGNVWVKMYADERWVHIIVKDNGIGIPIQSQGTIFDRFVQHDKSLTRLNEGSGIGLSIVQSAVRLNEGEIYLDSDGENGTEFEILLPNKKLEGEYIEERYYEVDAQNIELELSDIYELHN